MPEYEIFRVTEDEPFGILREPIEIEGNQDGIRWALMKRTIATVQPIVDHFLSGFYPSYRVIQISHPLARCAPSMVVASTHLLADTEVPIPADVLENCRDAALAGVAATKTGGDDASFEILKDVVPETAIRAILPLLPQLLQIGGGLNYPTGITAQAGPRAIHLHGKNAPKPLPPRPDDIMRDFQGAILSIDLDRNSVLIRLEKGGKNWLGYDRSNQFPNIIDLMASCKGRPVPCSGIYIHTTDIKGRVRYVLSNISPLDSDSFKLTSPPRPG